MIYEYIILKPRARREDEDKDEHRMGVYFEMNMALSAPIMARQLEEIRNLRQLRALADGKTRVKTSVNWRQAMGDDLP
jgi:CMP-2-keto-3-deoxyoctulosonic acid synthetase